MKDAYVAQLIAKGKDAFYIDALFSNINMGTFAISMISILVFAIIGGIFEQKMLKKHFVKVGIV